MIIKVHRYMSSAEATLSRLFVDGTFVCYGLEDAFRPEKIDGETRIPAGVYKIVLRREGPNHLRYAADRRFRDIHDGMLWVQDVPGFAWILIHVGNTARDTRGCLLVGMERDETRLTLSRSGEGYRHIYQRVLPAARSGSLTIVFEDADR